MDSLTAYFSIKIKHLYYSSNVPIDLQFLSSSDIIKYYDLSFRYQDNVFTIYGKEKYRSTFVKEFSWISFLMPFQKSISNFAQLCESQASNFFPLKLSTSATEWPYVTEELRTIDSMLMDGVLVSTVKSIDVEFKVKSKFFEFSFKGLHKEKEYAIKDVNAKVEFLRIKKSDEEQVYRSLVPLSLQQKNTNHYSLLEVNEIGSKVVIDKLELPNYDSASIEEGKYTITKFYTI